MQATNFVGPPIHGYLAPLSDQHWVMISLFRPLTHLLTKRHGGRKIFALARARQPLLTVDRTHIPVPQFGAQIPHLGFRQRRRARLTSVTSLLWQLTHTAPPMTRL